MKKYFIYAVSALALAGCSSDDFLGGQPSPTKLTDNNVINFNGDRSSTTRAPKSGSDAATKLGKNFVVYGYKNGSEIVYDHYNVNWAGTAMQTESNKAGWEYVGQKPNMLSSLTVTVQTIKYWDYSASQYDFIAFSLGAAGDGNRELTQIKEGTPTSGQVLVSKISNTPDYTLTGDVGDLAKVYIADRVTAKKGVTNTIPNRLVSYGTSIPFNFRSLGTKVRIGLYETIPGYSVKDVKFYNDNTENAKPCLYASSAKIPKGSGTMKVTFPTTSDSETDYNKAHVSWVVADGSSNVVSVLELENYSLGNKNADQKEDPEDNYLVRTSTDARNASYKTVLPAPVGKLTLKVDYTLVSIDGSGEKINVKGATAVVPEVYTNWEPNYAYTYIFKISDNTNGSTGGTGDPAGLYPITFDAIVTNTGDGLSETITTVSEPSITTYANGAVGNEYKAGSNVYVSVMNGTAMASLVANGVNANCALYTAESTNYIGGITESTVANCLVNGTQSPDGTWTATDAHDGKLTVKTVKPDETANGLSATKTIDAADTADGNAITASNGRFAKFKPTKARYYVFQYWNSTGKYYKVIKVVN